MTRAERTGPRLGRRLRWAGCASVLLVRFAADMVLANLEQARLILSLRPRVEPRWMELTTRLKTDRSRALLGAMISMTPGTLTCECVGDRLLLHALRASSDEEVLERVVARFETPLLCMEELA